MELGSDFELDISNLQQTKDNVIQYLSSYNSVYMDSGRSAAIALNRMLGRGIILLPSYICESVINVYKVQFRIKFYRIKSDFSVDINDIDRKINEGARVVYIMHYFGQLQDEAFLSYLNRKKQEYGFTIIEDTTHSVFTEARTIGDYCICSLRKWFPIMDGGVLYSGKPLSGITDQDIPHKNPSEKLYAMVLKHMHIEGEIECNNIYRKIFIDEEDKLDSQKGVFYMSDLSRCLLSYFSIKRSVEVRKRNYWELDGILRKIGVRGILKGDEFTPLCYPIYIDNRDRFRNYLIGHQVYCAVH